MTVVLRDSIQTKPQPIANAIIHIAVTRLVTAKKKFSEKPNTFSDNSGMGIFAAKLSILRDKNLAQHPQTFS